MENMKKSYRNIMMFCLIICVTAAGILPSATARAATKSASEDVKITVSFAGDCTLGVDSRYNNRFNEQYAKSGAKYFLKKVKPYFENDDLTLVNFEGTLTNSKNRANKTFTFKGPKKYTKILTSSSVEAVNIANNHSHDFGSKGFSDTKMALNDAGILYSGYNRIAYTKVNGVKIAMIGINALGGTSKSDVEKLIKKARNKKAKLVIVSFHWGIERDGFANSTQKSLGHTAIDSGADIVIGHHPHVLQGVESYKGHYIVYSLGNFCFGGNSNPSDKDSMIFRATFTIHDGKVKKNAAAKIIPCSVSSVSYRNDFRPTPKSGSEGTRILNKIRNRSKGMNVTISKKGVVKKK